MHSAQSVPCAGMTAILLLTLGAHAHKGYGSLSVCLSVCLLPIYCLLKKFI